MATVQKAPLAPQKITPPALARKWGIDVEKVLTWIRTGQLRAINGAENPDGRPRYLIDLADIEDFERRRQAGPAPKPVRRRRAHQAAHNYF